MSARRRVFGAILAVTMVIGSVAVASPAEEGEFLTLLNSARNAEGLSPLAIHNDLVVGARGHTSVMVARGEIFHSTSAELGAVTTGWQVLGENVGVGPNPSVLHSAFMNSPGHRANVLGDFNFIGIGAERAPDGKLFVTFMFMKKPVSATTTTTTVAPTITAPAPLPAPPPTTTTTVAPAPAPAPVPVPVPAPAPEPVPDSEPAAPPLKAGVATAMNSVLAALHDDGVCTQHWRYPHICIQ